MASYCGSDSRCSPPKRSGLNAIVSSESGKALLRVEGKDRMRLRLTLLPHAGGTRVEAESALKELLNQHWP